jgi:Domain of unknown function (DUF4385)
MPKKKADKTSYADQYRDVDFRRHPERYRIGRGEQGVLIAEPYKSEILPHWRFATPEKAQASAEEIYQLFLDYKGREDFVGMDMARKFLQMGFTRSRRYANHASGKKYDGDGQVRDQDEGSEDSPKAESARIFYRFYRKAAENPDYQRLRAAHKQQFERSK